MGNISRRDLLVWGSGACLALWTPSFLGCNDGNDRECVESGNCNKNTGSPGADRKHDNYSTVYAVMGDELGELYSMAREAAEKLGITRNSLRGAKVFIKPNLVALGLLGYIGTNGECTKAEIVAAVAEQCLDAGAARVIIGDGAQGRSWDWSTLAFLGDANIAGAADLAAAVDRLKSIYGDYRIDLACLNEVDQWEYIPSSSNDSRMKNGLMVARYFYEADHVISIAVLKSHMWADITGSMKNYIGLTPINQLGTGFCRSKVHLAYSHAPIAGLSDAGVAGAFLDIVKWRKEEKKDDFAIIDCSIGVEGSGPHVPPINPGKTIDIKQRSLGRQYFLLAGNDFVAADSIAAQVMDFHDVKQLVMAENMALGEARNIHIKGANPRDLFVPGWEKPKHLSDDFFKPIDRIFGK